MTLPVVEVDATGKVRGTVLWLHGLGADGHDFESLVPMLGLPEVRFVFPHAPRRPVTVNLGLVIRAWYDIRSLGKEGGEDEDEEGIRASAGEISLLIEREAERGVQPNRLVLAGFSQGGALALHVGVRYPKRLLGILVLSGYEVLRARRSEQDNVANGKTPGLFCHGTLDPLVPVEAGRDAAEAFGKTGREVEFHEFRMGHEICPEEIDIIRKWLNRRFSEEEV